MAGRGTSLFLVSLMLLSLLAALPPAPLTAQPSNSLEETEALFQGFTTGDNWLHLNNQTVAVPDGFNAIDVYDYSDVGVLINNKSESSKTIGWAFVEARNISHERVFIFDLDGTPTAETINRDQFNTYFAYPFLEMLNNRSNVSDMNYLVTSKGMPLRVNGGQNKASFDQEFALLGGSYNSSIGGDYWATHSYGPLSGGEFESFSRQKHGFYLVTRLTGYTVETALELIEKKPTTVWAKAAPTSWIWPRTETDQDTSSGTMICILPTRRFPMCTIKASSSMRKPILSPMSATLWGTLLGVQTTEIGVKIGVSIRALKPKMQRGQAVFVTGMLQFPHCPLATPLHGTIKPQSRMLAAHRLEATISASCTDESSNGTQGIFAEYFDNEGVSFNTGSMPSLIDRVPEHTRIESSLQYGSMYSAYPGLDDRFKNNWGARFSGLIDIPDSGNWTFYLTSDDGSELWIDGTSLVTNYGSHGMREKSGMRNLTSGLHDFKIEFFQGGGPHGLHLKWEGPNQSKAMVPASAFVVSDGLPPSPSTLIHAWNFDEGVWYRVKRFCSKRFEHDLVQHGCQQLALLRRWRVPMVRWC